MPAHQRRTPETVRKFYGWIEKWMRKLDWKDYGIVLALTAFFILLLLSYHKNPPSDAHFWMEGRTLKARILLPPDFRGFEGCAVRVRKVQDETHYVYPPSPMLVEIDLDFKYGNPPAFGGVRYYRGNATDPSFLMAEKAIVSFGFGDKENVEETCEVLR